MNHTHNELGQPIGPPLPNWVPPTVPPREVMVGRYTRLEPLDASIHAEVLFREFARDPSGRSWTYLSAGPFPNAAAYREWIALRTAGDDPIFFAILDRSTREPLGIASYLRITPASGSIEVGHLHFSPRIKGTSIATEAMVLMMAKAFALGYRRYEWKCDSLNAASRAAALRLGFTFEGVFRQATVYKGRTRDSAWFSVIDSEWPKLKVAFDAWLAPENFVENGLQRSRLSDLTADAIRTG